MQRCSCGAGAFVIVEQVVPRHTRIELDEALTSLTNPAKSYAPFSQEIIDFCSEFSRAIFKDREALQFPELQALAFWMRKAELVRMQEQYRALASPDTLLVPRGVVFHVPPANVDTIFVYSWLLSVLAGNRNVIRLSNRTAAQTEILCRILNETIEKQGNGIGANTVMIRYGHERDITETISAHCDVRVIWGGDGTVNAIRSVPLPPHAKELAFPDRYSLAAISAAPYLRLNEDERKQVAEKFYNDTFWFDQMGCSSPQLLVWCGSKEECEGASDIFYASVAAQIQKKGYQLETATRIHKLTFACRAVLDEEADAYNEVGQLSLLHLYNLERLRRDHCGGGLLFQFRVDHLDNLVDSIARRDQTLTQYGFELAELREFVARLNGRGIDRIVPMGQALLFNRYWDGYDLLQELSRIVYVKVS